ncbi:DUF3558 domain-containing protein [Amycolatopsis nivea]
MKGKFAKVSVGIAATVMLAAGCSGGSTPAPPPVLPGIPGSSSAAGKSLPYAGAPKVENPLPDSVLSTHPCDSAFTSGQVLEILGKEVPGKHADNSSLGAQCHWLNSDSGAVLTVLYVTKVSDGLSAVYANSKPQSTVWRPLPLTQGLPAVAHSSYGAKGDKSFCQVSIGINDRHDVDVSVTLSPSKVGTKNPCDVTAQISEMVVVSLKQRAGA